MNFVNNADDMVKQLFKKNCPDMTQLKNNSQNKNPRTKTIKDKSMSLNPESSQAEEMVLLIKRQRERKSSFSFIKLVIVIMILLILGTLFYFLFLKTGVFRSACLAFYSGLTGLYSGHPALTFAVLWVVEVLSLMLLLPFYSILTFIVCSLFKSFWLSYLFCLFCSLCGSSVIYLLCSTQLKPHLTERFSKNVLFDVLQKYSREQPWKTAFLTRFLFIAAGVKEYILALIDNPFWPFIGSACCLHSLWILEVCFIHLEVGEISSFMDRGSTPWADRSFTEKVYTVLGFLVIGFTVLFMAFLGLKAKTLVAREKEKGHLEKKVRGSETLETIV